MRGAQLGTAVLLALCFACGRDRALAPYASSMGIGGAPRGGSAGGAGMKAAGGSGGRPSGGDAGEGGSSDGGQGGSPEGGLAGTSGGGRAGTTDSGGGGAGAGDTSVGGDESGSAGQGGAGEGGLGTATRPPPASDVFMVEDFERGPDPHDVFNQCATVSFSGYVPGSDQYCGLGGISPAGCAMGLYCDDAPSAGVCPAYIGRGEGAFRGDASLRLYYDLGSPLTGFAGIELRFGDPGAGDKVCLGGRSPADLSGFESLVFSLRAGDDLTNLEVAVQAAGADPGSDDETLPKLSLEHALNPSGGTPPGRLPPRGKWVRVKFPLCDLLHKDNMTLDVTQMHTVLIGVANRRFREEATFQSGVRYVDLDDVYFEPCHGDCTPCSG